MYSKKTPATCLPKGYSGPSSVPYNKEAGDLEGVEDIPLRSDDPKYANPRVSSLRPAHHRAPTPISSVIYALL